MERFPDKDRIAKILFADVRADIDIPTSKQGKTFYSCEHFAQQIINYYRIMKSELMEEVRSITHKKESE